MGPLVLISSRASTWCEGKQNKKCKHKKNARNVNKPRKDQRKSMGKSGTQCCSLYCNKRKKQKENNERSDSEGSDDEESKMKRKFPRTFHAYVASFVLFFWQCLDSYTSITV